MTKFRFHAGVAARAGAAVVMLFMPARLLSTPVPEADPPLRGYVMAIAGERLDYNCFNPLATTALLTRCTTGEMLIEWETERVPGDAAGPFVEFKWVVSYSTVTSAGNRSFAFSINGQKTFDIKTSAGINPREWTEKSADGTELRFQFVRADAAGDANGYMVLRIPLSRVEKGEPLRLRVVGEKANSSDWFMTFMYDLRDAGVEVLPVPLLLRTEGVLQQSVFVVVTYAAERGEAALSLDGATAEKKVLTRGPNLFEFRVPAVTAPKSISLTVSVNDAPLESFTVPLKPVTRRTIHLLPHAHTDIGYTDLQPEVLKTHVRNITDALALIRKTAAYPPAARFKWNTEVSWAVEAFLRNAGKKERDDFLAAVRDGNISVQALYANTLTGIMRPEEFFRLTEFARSLRSAYGIPVTTAMMSDIPGMTWNMIPAAAEAGVKYFSSGPNGQYLGGDRTGHANRAWADRPFYWVSPSGDERILYWMTGYGYSSPFARATSGTGGRMEVFRSLHRYFEWLDAMAYPYDMIQMRHSVNGDNGTVDPQLPAFVRDWNESFLSPKLAISTVESLFGEFERKYGAGLPAYAGDFTPYWEDGAASTAYELGVNRTTAERLLQTEALAAIIAPRRYDPAVFAGAWKKVLLFDEHTWGAHNSISHPDSSFVAEQWEIKRRFAEDGASMSAGLRATVMAVPADRPTPRSVDVINTNSWERSDLVLLSRTESAAGDVVKDEAGDEVPSQRLSDGSLAFFARQIPPLGGKRFTLHAGTPSFTGTAAIADRTIRDDNLEVRVDERTGAISRLRTLNPLIEYVDTTGGGGLNEFWYVAGLDAREALTNAPPVIAIGERGPLVASLVVTSGAPGCAALKREIRLISGTGRVEVTNTIDKMKVRTKEAVHFGFPFGVPEGVVRVDLGYAVIRPEADQLPGSCKDFISAQRWVDVSNQGCGITWTVFEAPLVEVGELHSELPSPRNPAWRTVQPSSPRLASYVMNNYWHTNYRADQEGISTYHYSLHPHGMFNEVSAARAGIERSQPLIVRPVGRDEPKPVPPLSLDRPNVMVTWMKPVDGGRGIVVRLFNAGGVTEVVKVKPGGRKKSVYRSTPFEERGERIEEVAIPAKGLVTLRIE